MITQTANGADRPETMLHVAAAAAFLVASILQTPLLAQGLESEEAIDAIVGSDVKTEEVKTDSARERVLAAIESARESAERARKTFSLQELDIVFLSDLSGNDNEKVLQKAIAENEQEIQTLQEAIEGSALFYHAVDSRSIMVSKIVALEYGEDKVTIFVDGAAPAN